MATTETAATDSRTIMKGTTEENRTDSRDERMKIHQVSFCSFVPFIIVAAVFVVAIMVSIDKNSNHSKTNIHSIRKSGDFNDETVRRGNSQAVTRLEGENYLSPQAGESVNRHVT